MPENKDLLQHMENALDEIDNNLHQMLILAELSASDLDLDRAALQKTLERLRGKIDAIADTLE
jgi:flagellin-like hook-associated protein FlgL